VSQNQVFVDITTILFEFKKILALPQFSYLYAPAFLRITTGGAQQPAVVTADS
jgi:hypothetical protein